MPTRPDSRRTVFFVVPLGFAARMLLRTDVLRTILAAGHRAVILTPNADERYLAEELGPEVRLELLRISWEDKTPVTRSRFWAALYYLRTHTLARGHETAALVEKAHAFRAVLAGRSRLLAVAFAAALHVLWRSALARQMLLRLEARLFRPALHADLFEAYAPDLVVTTSPGWFLPDAVVLREAAERRIPCVSVVLSWDNPSSKGYRGAAPDLIVAWSEEMARQVAAYHDFPRARIAIGGVPHFDHYLREDALLSRRTLFAELDLDPDRPLVLFTTSLPRIFGQNAELAERLAQAANNGNLGAPVQLVIRLHPINFRAGERPRLGDIERVAAAYEGVRIDVPKILSDRLICDLPMSDGVRLGSLIRHCDVLVNVFSTTTLEAFLNDRPVVLVTSHADERGIDFAQYAHVRSILDEGAARIARSLPEAVDLVRRYLAEPELDREGRRRVARRELGPTDGRSGERVGRLLLDLLSRDERARTS